MGAGPAARRRAAPRRRRRWCGGTHDFRAFAARLPPKPHYDCTVRRAEWVERAGGAGVSFHIEGDRFLHHMVRFLTGTMVDIALGRRPVADMHTLLARTDNLDTSPPAPPQGLFFTGAIYPPDWYLDVADVLHVAAALRSGSSPSRPCSCAGARSWRSQRSGTLLAQQTRPRPTQNLTASRRTAIVDASARVGPSVVSITVTSRQRVQSQWDFFFVPQEGEQLVTGYGTGFVLRPDGIIVTNQHVVAGAEKIVVTLGDGTDLTARAAGRGSGHRHRRAPGAAARASRRWRSARAPT